MVSLSLKSVLYLVFILDELGTHGRAAERENEYLKLSICESTSKIFMISTLLFGFFIISSFTTWTLVIISTR